MATLDPRHPMLPPPATPHPHHPAQPSDVALSSSPAFATPAHPIRPKSPHGLAGALQTSNRSPSVLPILLPPATLRPIAFRTFTKKHNLNLTLPALQALATFIGKQCGAAWREDGLAEPVLEEVARSWKRLHSNPIVDGGQSLQTILQQLQGTMTGGKLTGGKSSLSRQTSWTEYGNTTNTHLLQRQESFGMGALEVDDLNDEELRRSEQSDPRSWLKVINAFDQPRLTYNSATKHFEKSKLPASFFPPPAQKTELFRQRYHLIHQRVLRNESFQAPSAANSGRQQWQITSIANLLGRSGTGHLLLGLLTITPAGSLAISDLTGSIHLDLDQATTIDLVHTWLCPGMIVLVDGVYEEQHNTTSTGFATFGGIGGTIGGRFVGFSVGAPRCETRAATLGIIDSHASPNDLNVGGGFGWIDFLGLGSERAVGSRMRKIEQRLLSKQSHDRLNSNKVVLLGDCNLDNPQTLSALRTVFQSYSTPFALEPTIPLAFVLYGNFTAYAAMSSTSSNSSTASTINSSSTSATATGIPDSILYKESFDSLALLLADFPMLLKHCTWIFVPGDNDAWPSSFSAGASTPLPRQAIPEMFTSRIRRAFTTANGTLTNGEAQNHDGSATKKPKGEVIFTSNPSRLSLFGPSCEMVLFRDDVSARMRRNAIPLATRRDEQEGDVNAQNVNHQMNTETHFPPLAENISYNIDSNVNEVVMSGALPSSPPPEAESATIANKNVTPSTTDQPSPKHQESAAATDSAKQPPLQSQAQSLVKTLLDQHCLSPFPLNIRPVHWSFASSALSLYPLPSCLVLSDAGMDAWSVRYQGVEVLNAGRLCSGSSTASGTEDQNSDPAAPAAFPSRPGIPKRRNNTALPSDGSTSTSTTAASKTACTWVEFDVLTRRGAVRHSS